MRTLGDAPRGEGRRHTGHARLVTEAAYSVAVDGTSVYWANPDGVMKVALGGGTPVTLASDKLARDIAIDASSVYWTSGDTTANTIGHGGVMKVPLGGGTPVTLASDQVGPSSIAVDPASVYWTGACVMKLLSTAVRRSRSTHRAGTDRAT